MTIQDIQSAIDAKYDTRQIVNMIADYIEDNSGGDTFDIHALADADTLTGDEEVPLYQTGNKKVTVNDLLPVQLQENKTIDLNGKDVILRNGVGLNLLSLGSSNFNSELRGTDGVANSYIEVRGDANDPTVYTYLSSSDGSGHTSTIKLYGTESEIEYTADNHTFNGVMNLPTQAAPASPNDGDIWREDNTDTGLKIRINGLTKTITVS